MPISHTSNAHVMQHFKTLDLAYIALFAALMAICSWISIPTTIPFTMQTFAIFAAVGLLGGKRGTLAIVLYLLLGLVGLPVFAGFQSGFGVLLGTTGGYLIGFICCALVYWLVTALLGKKPWIMALGMLAGLLACYAFGTVWFTTVYLQTTGSVGLATVLGWCVIPFVVPDLCKIALALLVAKRVQRYTKL